MSFRRQPSPLRSWRMLAIRPLLFGLLALALFVWIEPSHATGAERATQTAMPALSASNAVATTGRAFASYVVLLEDEPVAVRYAALAAGDSAQSANLNALTQAHLATIDQAQQQLVATLANHEAQVLYRVQRVYHGVAIRAPVAV